MKLRQQMLKLYPFLKLYQRVQQKAFAAKPLRVLLFHEITNLTRFEELITSLIKDYSFLTPEEFEQVVDGQKKLERPSLLVTFDDGYKSSFEAAMKVLEPKNIKSVFFISTNFMDLDAKESFQFVKNNIQVPLKAWDEHFLAMTWDEVRELHRLGHKIASHTGNHARMNTLTDTKEFLLELQSSADSIETQIGSKPEWFAYPFGDIGSINARALQEIKKSYKKCFAGVRGWVSPGDSPYALTRESMSLNDEHSFNEMIVLGALDPYYSLARKKLHQMDEQSSQSL
ncbi:MAG: polysaccharide deacetylase family protein [Bdellovibrionales bacterium]